MTESEFLESTSADYNRLAAQIDGLLLKATPATWQATNSDNGWTTAQIVEHLWRTQEIYDRLVGPALERAETSGGASQAKPTFFGKTILNAVSTKTVPAPSKIVVVEVVTPETAQQHWASLKDSVMKHVQNAQGKRLDQPAFRNPFFPLFKVNVVDSLALMVAHLRYHEPQIRRRVETSA